MTVTAADIAKVAGEAPPERPAPRTKAEAVLNGVDDVNSRLSDLAERERQPGETREGAMSRVLSENPQLYAAHKSASAKVLRKAGWGDDAACGGT